MGALEDTIRDLQANLSWYKLNSNFNDPMFQSQTKLLGKIISTAVPKTNFTMIIETSNVIDVSPILRYGSIPCSAPGKEAYMDSEFSCALFQLPYFLEKIQFGYLCSIVIIPIMLISVFGKIKESYRWFLLNQAIWDVFMCYSFICEKPTILSWEGTTPVYRTQCFYNYHPNPIIDTIFVIIKGSFRNAPYIPLFLLAFSRCISLYFPKFYQRNNQTWKILSFILIFDVTIMILSSSVKLYNNFISYLQAAGLPECFKNFCPEFTDYQSIEQSICFMKNEKFFQCLARDFLYYQKFLINARYSHISVTPAMFILVLLCVFLLFAKILLQLKYQLKHNRYAFIKTIKVAAVILIQSITLTFYLLVTAFQQYLQINAYGDYFTDTRIYASLSPTLFLLQSSATTTSINIIRIFFDSFIVLTVLSGYRKRIFKFFCFIFNVVKKGVGKSQTGLSTSTTAVNKF